MELILLGNKKNMTEYFAQTKYQILNIWIQLELVLFDSSCHIFSYEQRNAG